MPQHFENIDYKTRKHTHTHTHTHTPKQRSLMLRNGNVIGN